MDYKRKTIIDCKKTIIDYINTNETIKHKTKEKSAPLTKFAEMTKIV